MSDTESTQAAFRSAEPLLLRRPVAAELHGVVRDIAGYSENGQCLSRHIEMASLVVPLIISFGEGFAIAFGRAPGPADAVGSFTSGLFAGHVVIDSGGAAQCVQINFTPLGACRFFGLPMSELADRLVRLDELDELDDPDIAALQQRLGDETNWAKRLELAEGFVIARLRRAPQTDPAVDWAYGQIVSRGGNLRISQIAGKLEWSRKHLAQRFRDQLGLAPKPIARMVRFHRAMAMASAEPGVRWAEIAAACGYADQPHLTREFSEFAGTSPVGWQARAA